MTWDGEFPADYAVPKWFVDHPDLDDTSWHNDASPSFETRKPEDAQVRIWVDHPDPAERETQREHRYWVQLVGDGEDAGGVSRYCADIWVVETDDLRVVDCALRWAQDLLARYGLSMCPQIPTYGEDGDPGLFPAEQQRLFDPGGRPNFPSLSPLPPPCDIARPRGEVERALEAINEQRRAVGQPELDPEAAGWKDQDVLEEAKRIRLKNRLTAI